MALTLPYSQWPEADTRLWVSLFTEGNPLDERGQLAHLRETSRESLLRRYARWLKWLAHTRPAALLQPPAERVQLEALRAWLRDLDHTQPVTRRSFVDGVLRVAMAASPDRDWTAEEALVQRLRRIAKRARSQRKQGRILSSQVLFEAGQRLVFEEAPRINSALFRATTIRDGAMIALLALMPMRRRSLAGLRIDVSFLTQPQRYSIALPGDLTKSGLPWEADVPAPAAELLRAYLTEARPLLAARGGWADDHLWLGRKGRKFGEDYLGTLVSKGVERMTGVPVSPHLFRDAAATTLSRHSPKAATLIRGVLAHTSDRTAEKHYIHATSIDAGQSYAEVLRKRRMNELD